jgi:uncharacterized protein YjbJ (UPF0337 family)
MDKQRVKGAIDEAVGSTKRHIGNMTGNSRTQVEGAVQQVKGKVETAVGKMKDSARDENNKLAAQQKTKADADRSRREVVITGDSTIM